MTVVNVRYDKSQVQPKQDEYADFFSLFKGDGCQVMTL